MSVLAGGLLGQEVHVGHEKQTKVLVIECADLYSSEKVQRAPGLEHFIHEMEVSHDCVSY